MRLCDEVHIQEHLVDVRSREFPVSGAMDRLSMRSGRGSRDNDVKRLTNQGVELPVTFEGWHLPVRLGAMKSVQSARELVQITWISCKVLGRVKEDLPLGSAATGGQFGSSQISSGFNSYVTRCGFVVGEGPVAVSFDPCGTSRGPSLFLSGGHGVAERGCRLCDLACRSRVSVVPLSPCHQGCIDVPSWLILQMVDP
jgi:hypothetical protein